jgi:hypothetical protein
MTGAFFHFDIHYGRGTEPDLGLYVQNVKRCIIIWMMDACHSSVRMWIGEQALQSPLCRVRVMGIK